MKNIFTLVCFLGFIFGILNEAWTQPVIATADPSAICFPGGDSQLDVELNGAPGNTYSWTPITNLSDPSIKNPVASGLTETIEYTVEVDGSYQSSVTITIYDELTASISPDQTICFNTAPAQLNSNVNGGNAPYTYQWQKFVGPGWSDIGQNTSSYDPGNLDTTSLYRLIVNDNDNCGPDTSNIVTITVYEELIASISEDQTICFNTEPSLLTSEVSGGDGSYSYQWYINDGSNWSIIDGADTAIYQPEILEVSTDYRLGVNDDSNCGPVTTNAVAITVYEDLTASITEDQTICYNTSPVQLTSSVTGGIGPYTYQWQKFEDPDWSDIDGEENPIYQPGDLDTTSLYRLIVNDGANCGPDTSNFVTITVYPEFNIGIISGAISPICYGDDGDTLQANPSGGSNNYTITWYDGDNSPLGTGIEYIVGNLIDTTSFYYHTLDDEGCGDENSIDTTIIVFPEFDIGTITGGISPICSGEDAGVLNSNPEGGSNNYTITWYNGDNDSIGSGSTYVLGELTDTTTIYYNAFDNAGCGEGNSGLKTISVTPNETATISILPPEVEICSGDAITFKIDEVFPEDSLAEFNWYINDNSIASGPSFTSTELKDDDKVYAHFLPSDDVCVLNDIAISNTITGVVNPLPAADSIVAKYNPDNGLTPYVLIYPGNPEGHTYSYQWYQNNTLLENDTLKFYYPGEGNTIVPGATYMVKIENEYKCAREITYSYNKNKSLLFESADIFSIYPNPSHGQFTVILNEDNVPENFESGSLRIIDMGGKIVFKNELNNTEQSFNINNIDKGLYFIEVLVSGTQKQIKKIMFY